MSPSNQVQTRARRSGEVWNKDNPPPDNPHAIIEVTMPDNQQIIWDSWDAPRLFERVSVELVTNQSSQAEWKFFDPEFRVINALCLPSGIPMATVRVFLGYGQNLGAPVFKGLLARVERGDSSSSFTAYDMGFRMKLLKRAGYHNKKDDLGILKALAERNKLKFSPPSNPLKLEPHRAMTQDEQTDWEHALERARDAGLVIFVREDTLFARYPAKTGTPVLTLINRKDFTMAGDFDFVYKTPESKEGRARLIKMRGRGRRGRRLEGISDAAKRGREVISLKQDFPGKHTKKKLSRRAQAQKELEREHAFEGRVRMIFPPNVRPDARQTVSILGVGNLFGNEYIVDSARYDFAPGKLEMSLELYRDAKDAATK